MLNDKLVPIYQTTDVGRAEIIKGALEDEGIHCAIENAHQAGLSGVLECRLLVMEPDEVRAKEFIAEHERHHG